MLLVFNANTNLLLVCHQPVHVWATFNEPLQLVADTCDVCCEVCVTNPVVGGLVKHLALLQLRLKWLLLNAVVLMAVCGVTVDVTGSVDNHVPVHLLQLGRWNT